ncbi:Glycosyl hydrolase family 92 [compost metagenome]
MSAWYLFSAIGVYPAVPGSGEFLLHTPRFAKVEVDLGTGRTLTLAADGADGRRLQYVQDVRVDGQQHAPVWLDWTRLQQGGRIEFALGEQAPTTGWGTRAEALPRSFCATPGAVLE